MAKKKKRYKKKRGKPCNSSVDNHHLLWPRRTWGRQPQRKLRCHPYCSVVVPKNTLHRLIHSETDPVPVPNDVNIDSALYQLNLLERFGGISLDDPIEKRLMVLAAIFDCSEQPTADMLRKQMEVVRKFYEPS